MRSTVADLERLAAAPGADRAGARAGGFPVVESRAAVPRAARGQPVGVPASADAGVRVDHASRDCKICTTCKGPVIFAANHQSHMDVPVILAALPGRWRRRVATAMAKEFFKAHFFPEQYTRRQRFTQQPRVLPLGGVLQHVSRCPSARRARARRCAMRATSSASGFSVLIFPEGKRTDHGEIAPFRPGVGMMASRLGVPVIPVRLEGIDRVLHQTWKMAKPGPVTRHVRRADAANWR